MRKIVFVGLFLVALVFVTAARCGGGSGDGGGYGLGEPAQSVSNVQSVQVAATADYH